jgi:hypothetical protein
LNSLSPPLSERKLEDKPCLRACSGWLTLTLTALGACGGGVRGPVGGSVLSARAEEDKEARSRIGLMVRGKVAKGRAAVLGLTKSREVRAGDQHHMATVGGIIVPIWRKDIIA